MEIILISIQELRGKVLRFVVSRVNFISCLKNNQHDVTFGLSFIFVGSRHSLSTCFELSGSSSSGDHFSVQSASGIVCNLCCSPPVLLRVLLPTVCVSEGAENKG